MKNPKIMIYKWMIFDFNASDGNGRPKEIGGIFDFEPYFELDEGYDRSQVVWSCITNLVTQGINFSDEYFGPFLKWALKRE